jgi:hypothetical protein
VRRPLLEVTNTGLLQQQQLQQQEDDSTRHQQKKKKTGTEPAVEEPVASATKTRYYKLTPKDPYLTVCASQLMKLEGRGMLGWAERQDSGIKGHL